MEKIVPLVALSQVDNYLSSNVDAVTMGTFFGATRQTSVYSLEEIIEVNQEIPVIACYNRFYFEHEISQLEHELKALYEGGIDRIVCGDFAVLQIIYELDLDFDVTLDTDTTMTNGKEISLMHQAGAKEVVVGRELTLDERLSIAKEVKGDLGMHVFGYQLMSFSRRKHLSQYAALEKIEIDTHEIHWIKETKRDERYMIFEDEYGTHTYAPEIISVLHAFNKIKEAGYKHLYFDVIGLEIEDVLFVIRNLDLVEDYTEFERMIEELWLVELSHGLLYKETEAIKAFKKEGE